jgi:hypothetical protein
MPVAAQAQWATTRTEHDWRISVADGSYGLLQQQVYTFDLVHGYRRTTVYFGPHTWSTDFRAEYIVAAALMILVIGVLSAKELLWGVFSRRLRKCARDQKPDAVSGPLV